MPGGTRCAGRGGSVNASLSEGMGELFTPKLQVCLPRIQARPVISHDLDAEVHVGVWLVLVGNEHVGVVLAELTAAELCGRVSHCCSIDSLGHRENDVQRFALSPSFWHPELAVLPFGLHVTQRGGSCD